MQNNITKQQFNYLFYKIIFVWIIFYSNMQGQILYSNGLISTGATHSVTMDTAPAGYTLSELQSPGVQIGFGAQFNNALTTNNALADDFVVPTGQTWNITNVNVYGYQTSYTGSSIPIDKLHIRIWNGDPSLGTSTIVVGDMTTNRLNAAGSGDGLIYRVNTAVDTNRKVWRFNGTISASLTAGTYWIEYQVHATNDANIFVPPVTILGTQTLPTWNAKQRIGTTWANILDGGTNTKAIAFELIENTASSDSFDKDQMVSIYPNPSTGIFNFESKYNISFEVYDLVGKKIITQKVNNATTKIDLSNYLTGIYLLKITNNENKTKIIKLLKQ